MKRNITIAYLIALFPPTGILGFHQLYLQNFKKFLIRLTIIGGLILWIPDLINLPKMVRKFNRNADNQIGELIELLDKGKLKEALKLCIKTGRTQVFVKEIIKTGKGDVLVKHFAKNDNEKQELKALISNGDTESLVIHLTKFYANTKLTEFLT